MISKTQVIQITLFLVCLINIRAIANEQESYIFSKIDYQQGLSNSAVICIFKDSTELMWFGTYDGVNCFDGRGVEVFRSDFSKSKTFDNNVIHGIQQADSNCLWISTYLGVNRFSLNTRQVVENYDFSRDWHLTSNSKGNTWVIEDGLISYYNTHFNDFIPVNTPDIKVTAPKTHSFVTDEGELWVFPDSDGEMFRFSLNAFDQDTLSTKLNVSSSRFHSKPIEYIFYQNNVSLCFIDSEMDLYMYYIARQNKVYIRNMASLIGEYGSIVGVVPFYDDIIVAFKTNGLIRLRTSEKYEYDIIDQTVRVFDIYKDPEQGVLWIGSDGQGAIMYARKKSIATNLMMPAISPSFNRQVRTIMTDKYGGLWFGTKGDGLLHIKEYDERMNPEKALLYFPSKKQPANTYTKENTEFQVYGLTQSQYRDGFWMGSSNDLYYYSFTDDRLHLVEGIEDSTPYGEIHSIHEENDSILFLATSGGGLRKVTLDKRSEKLRMKIQRPYYFFHEQQEISMFYSMISDGDSLLWLGSREKGLIRFDRRTDEYQVISLKERLNRSVDDVLCLHYSENGQMYVGTTSGLVTLTFQGRRVNAQYTGREQGLLNDMIHGILEDANGFLWLSTNKGLIKYNPSNGSSHAYYYTGGVQIGEFSDGAYYTCPYTDRLFFGGIDGLLYINKEVTTGPDYYPEILLRKLMLGRTEVNIEDYYTKDRTALQFTSSQNSFTLKFVAPDYVTGADMEYSYMLEGYDDEWKPFSSINEAAYMNIPVGKYQFHIRYKKDLFDSEFKSFSIPVYIQPFWYQTITAYVVYFLLGLFILFYIIFLLRKYIHHKQIVNKLLQTENQSPSEKLTSYEIQRLIQGFTTIYRICDQLRAENNTYEQRCQNIELIRETIMALLFSADVLENEKSRIFSVVHYSISGRLCIKDIAEEVLNTRRDKFINECSIHIDIPDSFSFPVYENAFRYLFYYVYLYVAHYKEIVEFRVDAKEVDGYMLLSFKAPEELLKELQIALTKSEVRIPGQVHEADRDFERRMLQRFAKAGLTQLQSTATFVESDQGKSLVITFPPVIIQESGIDKKTVLLLEDRNEMAWLIKDLLADEYTVHQVKSIQLAFDYMKQSPPALFLVDMLMYGEAESTFMELIKNNWSLLEKTAFIPMLTWEVTTSIQRELILWADSYLVLPYDMLFLKETIHKAIYGKKAPKQIYIDNLDSFVHLITCTTNEQADFIRKMMEVIEENLGKEELGSTFIAEQMAMSPRKFYRKFKEISGMPPTDLIKSYRMEKAALLLVNTELSIQEVITDVGISSRSYFYKEFTRKFGMTPKDYREQHTNN